MSQPAAAQPETEQPLKPEQPADVVTAGKMLAQQLSPERAQPDTAAQAYAAALQRAQQELAAAWELYADVKR